MLVEGAEPFDFEGIARGFNMVMFKCQNHHEALSSWDAIAA
jgi:hypothetical protein